MHDRLVVGFDGSAASAAALTWAGNEAGSNGLGPTKNFLLGSVLGAMLQRSPCPVAVVPPESHTPTGSIVAGVDGSESSDAALAWATDAAARARADLRVVHAWDYPYSVTSTGRSRGAESAEADASLVLESAVEVARRRATTSVGVDGALVEGSAAQVLLDASATADLIVVGSRGRGGFRSMLLGSVAQAVSVRAQCPVVVVRPLG